MTEIDTTTSGHGSAPAGGDTEIDLYADVVENELVTVRLNDRDFAVLQSLLFWFE